MKRKINKLFIIITVAAILLTLGLSTIVNYGVIRDEVMSDLNAYAYTLKGTGAFDDTNHIKYSVESESLRITLIQKNGKVLFDTKADITIMDNHGTREEVLEAKKNGDGQAVRRSSTLGKNTYYFAVMLDDGNVLRVAKEERNLFSVFASSLPVTIAIGILLSLLSLVLTHYLTKSIVVPIEQMAQNINNKDIKYSYKELRPFVTMIQKQHGDILKTAQMRQEFTANVSHELKTPLTAISGYAELIENGMATQEDVSRFANEIHQNANRLLNLINEIIRLSELDVSMDEMLLFENIDLYTLGEECVKTLAVNGKSHDVEIGIQGESCLVLANREMMNELLYNLCDNAIRYNNKGGSVLVQVGKEKNGEVVLSVKDTGIGIPEEHQERVFERFYRVDRSRSKSTGGTGLGLAIVKHIVAQNHARLELESEKGKGTLIRVIFPKELKKN